MEIVSKPDLRSPDEAKAYLGKPGEAYLDSEIASCDHHRHRLF